MSKETELWLATDGNWSTYMYPTFPRWKDRERRWHVYGYPSMPLSEGHPLAPPPGQMPVKVRLVKDG